ncbi:ABC transporter permease subunit [Enterococcus raffinosus]|uniref:ABC transporter permease subunit n=1 Tax=Enterococcus raffinosus TaxID=71452 RepID=A0AAW8T728_9ENTE|nr:ABC transporter permease subunit [Enterococcus raffinosus]MBS6432906.1 ABC transporter permease subunit [Enterococcus raffinosus]MDK7992928.1 ABC transporter permease subunit [Enterococcus raffinosus]MDT2540417.1 ABC transporter permease subunit [Enterococcus raffinosus]MDT2573999.1 ABC transporter permease subunit [Enterococcus raffinosus]QXJ61147.1 ABC transporter permease subunit [Enterococcus raffinosus]
MKVLHAPSQKNTTLKKSIGNLTFVIILALFAFILVFSLIKMNRPLDSLPSEEVLSTPSKTHDFLAISNLLYFSIRTMFRMIIGMIWSFLFSFVFGVLAVRYKTARRIILPMVNFLESVPLLGFLTFTTAWLLGLFPGNVLGAECVAIFAIFTGQAWNIMLTLYQIMEVIPSDLSNVTDQFKYNPWEKFWRLEFVYAIPGLLWNVIISQTAAWFALVASEQASVALPKDTTLFLPGIGSYIQIALDRADFKACLWAVLALLLNVIILNFLVFQPLVRATYYFKYETDVESTIPPRSIIYRLLKEATLTHYCSHIFSLFSQFWIYQLPKIWYFLKLDRLYKRIAKLRNFFKTLWYIGLGVLIIVCSIKLYHFLPHQDFGMIPRLTLYTTLRVTLAMIVAGLIFTPLAIWVASDNRRLNIVQPIGQILGSIPSNVYTPFIVIFISMGFDKLEWWILPLIMVGCQWYYFFNVIAGYLAIPDDIRDVTKIFKLSKWHWWVKYLIPSILPYIITAIINAAGAAWNADIAAESIQWGKKSINVTGLGQYISVNDGIKDKSALGTLAMCFVVGLCIAFVWQPLYRVAKEKFHY